MTSHNYFPFFCDGKIYLLVSSLRKNLAYGIMCRFMPRSSSTPMLQPHVSQCAHFLLLDFFGLDNFISVMVIASNDHLRWHRLINLNKHHREETPPHTTIILFNCILPSASPPSQVSIIYHDRLLLLRDNHTPRFCVAYAPTFLTSCVSPTTHHRQSCASTPPVLNRFKRSISRPSAPSFQHCSGGWQHLWCVNYNPSGLPFEL